MKKKLILIVDDEEDIRDSIKTLLEDEGYSAITAKTGKDALTKISKNPDLILLDIIMPGLTSKEILAKLKEKKIKVPILFLTVVKLSETSKKEILKDHVKDYIEKPFINEDLLKRIKKALK